MILGEYYFGWEAVNNRDQNIITLDLTLNLSQDID